MVHRAIARSARDHRHQLGELTSSLGSAILGHLLNLWMPPSNTGLLANTCTPEWVYRFPFGELTTSPGGFCACGLGLRVLLYNTIKVALSVLAHFGGV